MSNKRGWTFRLLALGLGLCSLFAIEGGARLGAGRGQTGPRAVLHPGVRTPGGCIVRVSPVAGFPAHEFPAAKGPNTKRIFIVGGSTALGFPYQGEYGLAELLRSALPIVAGGRSYEVINAAAFGYNSSRVAAVALEVLDYQPDALIVMTGHNEFLEKRVGGGWDFAAGRLLIGLERRLAASRIRSAGKSTTWARTSGRGWRPGWRPRSRVAAKAKRRGVKLLLLTCPSNLDFRPKGSGATPPAEQKKSIALLRAGKTWTRSALYWTNRSDSARTMPGCCMKGRLNEARRRRGTKGPDRRRSGCSSGRAIWTAVRCGRPPASTTSSGGSPGNPARPGGRGIGFCRPVGQ
ncbi:MAG: hypothetical protein MZU91_06400 [Desulfosudis oleivorans]|nr:hypothetical protein [Desulfosudis oleivorans]